MFTPRGFHQMPLCPRATRLPQRDASACRGHDPTQRKGHRLATCVTFCLPGRHLTHHNGALSRLSAGLTAEPEEGQIYKGKVVKVMDFGAFVNFFGSRDGLVHISQLAADRVAKTTDIVKEGDKVWVKLMGFDERGKVRLSMKVVDQETGQEIKKGEEDAA